MFLDQIPGFFEFAMRLFDAWKKLKKKISQRVGFCSEFHPMIPSENHQPNKSKITTRWLAIYLDKDSKGFQIGMMVSQFFSLKKKYFGN